MILDVHLFTLSSQGQPDSEFRWSPYENEFDFHENESANEEWFALTLVFTQRQGATWKWPTMLEHSHMHPHANSTLNEIMGHALSKVQQYQRLFQLHLTFLFQF